jgi:CheY-like chemotaxis protein
MTSETQPAAVPKSASGIGITTVAIVEDQRDIREGLASLITFTDGYQCTGSFRSMEEALEKIRFELPSIMLVDIGLPGMNGIEGIRLLKESYPQLLLLMLTVQDSQSPSSGSEYQKPNHVPKEVIDDIAAWIVANTRMK